MGKFSSGFFWGALIAGTYTLLHAKRSGEETRRLLSEYVEQVQEDASTVHEDFAKVQASIHHLVKDIAPRAQKLSQQVQTELRLFEEANRPRIRRVQEKLQELKTDLEDTTSDN